MERDADIGGREIWSALSPWGRLSLRQPQFHRPPRHRIGLVGGNLFTLGSIGICAPYALSKVRGFGAGAALYGRFPYI